LEQVWTGNSVKIRQIPDIALDKKHNFLVTMELFALSVFQIAILDQPKNMGEISQYIDFAWLFAA